MKILQVIPYFVPAYGYGGPVKVCFDISKELVKRGHRVTVVTTDALDARKRVGKTRENINGIEVIRFRNLSNWLAKNRNGFFPLGFKKWLRKNISQYDVVHCHDFFTYQNLVVSQICAKKKIPFIIQPHGSLCSVRQKSRSFTAKKIFLKLFLPGLFKSSKIIALTQKEKDDITRIDNSLKNKITILPNGLKLNKFKKVSKIDLWKKYNLPQENKIIGFIGRIQYIKGLDISLEILNKIKKEINFTFLIIGPDEGQKGNLQRQAKKLGIEENIIFTGMLKGKEKLQVIKSCNLFLFLSRSEGLPMTVLEIAALGVPQIISKNCNVPEIEEFNGGFEFRLKDKKEIARKILEIINSKKENYLKLKQGAIKMANIKFNLSKIINRLEIILKQ
jgi:glycosyltransferase involved in cell wall biosynthesis